MAAPNTEDKEIMAAPPPESPVNAEDDGVDDDDEEEVEDEEDDSDEVELENEMKAPVVPPPTTEPVSLKVGDVVPTPYGEGELLLYRETDQVYKVQLPNNLMVYCHKETLDKQLAIVEEKLAAKMKREMDLNVAYESLEKMRKLNLEVLCQEKGIPVCRHDVCSQCLLATAAVDETQVLKQQPQPTGRRFAAIRPFRRFSANATTTTTTTTASQQHQQQHRRSRIPTKKSPSCLACGTPCCKVHSAKAFRQHNINMCSHCEHVFGMKYVIDVLTAETAQQRRALLDQLMDMYDRVVLLLQYSSVYVDDLAAALEKKTKNTAKWGLGSSSAGIVSGVLGVAAAATMFTPAGPPLLVASLVFGGSASTVQMGAEARMHYSNTNKTAERILALYATLLNILRVVNTLRDALVRDQLRPDIYLFDEESKPNQHGPQDLLEKVDASYKDNRVGILAGVTATNSTQLAMMAAASETNLIFTAGSEAGAIAGKNARFMSRGSVAAMNTMRFAQFAGGGLAALTLVFEARNMSNVLQRMGSECEKAAKLRAVKRAVTDHEKIPTTAELDAECHRYLDVLRHRIRVMTEAEVAKLLMEQNEEILLEQEKEAAKNGEATEDPTNSEEEVGDENCKTSSLTPASELLEIIEQQRQQELGDFVKSDFEPANNDSGSDRSDVILSVIASLEEEQMQNNQQNVTSPPLSESEKIMT